MRTGVRSRSRCPSGDAAPLAAFDFASTPSALHLRPADDGHNAHSLIWRAMADPTPNDFGDAPLTWDDQRFMQCEPLLTGLVLRDSSRTKWLEMMVQKMKEEFEHAVSGMTTPHVRALVTVRDRMADADAENVGSVGFWG
jgi:hypothetical protein